MQIYPAIDIKRGKTAYLLNGRENDPVRVAEHWLAAGTSWLHVVDMDRAFETGADNTAEIRAIVAIGGASVQLGGLLHNAEEVRRGLDLGVNRVVAATATLLQPGLLEELLREAGAARLAVAIDVRQGHPVLRGSSRPVRESAVELAARARNAGVATIVYRDVDRDGHLSGFDAEGAAKLAASGDVIVSGGGASLADLRTARRSGVAGAILGRVLYEGRFTLEEAIACSQ